jgi:hypothetical protein
MILIAIDFDSGIAYNIPTSLEMYDANIQDVIACIRAYDLDIDPDDGKETRSISLNRY